MRIIILANNDVGLYKFRKELIEELIKDNEVIIALPYGEFVDPLVEMGCKFIHTEINRRGMNPLEDIGLMYKYFHILKEEKPDFVITYTIKPNVYGGLLCRILKIKYAINITGLGSAFENDGLLKTIVTAMNKISCKKAKVVFFENSSDCELFINSNILDQEQAHVLNGAGVNLDKYQVMEYPNRPIIKFLFIGRVMKEKGVDELFDAMKKLVEEGLLCTLDVLGGYEEDYKSVIDKYQKEGWLNYYGFQDDVRPFIKDANCFVLPSWHEGMANTNLENAASGRPVITSDIPGCKEAIVNNISGFLVERKNAQKLYETMRRFISLSNEQMRNMGLAGRAHMETHFDKRAVVADTIACINKWR